MIDDNTVLLSAADAKLDACGVEVRLCEGLPVCIRMEDVDENGYQDPLDANGVVVLNAPDNWAPHVKWCCRIDGGGIRRQSEIDGR